jgi:hypothetical protein
MQALFIFRMTIIILVDQLFDHLLQEIFFTMSLIGKLKSSPLLHDSGNVPQKKKKKGKAIPVTGRGGP